MSTIIINPSWTGEIVIRLFSRLVEYEITKNSPDDITNNIARQEGYQAGYMQCLSDIFHEVDEHEIMVIVREITQGQLSIEKTLMALNSFRKECDQEAIHIAVSKYIYDNTHQVLKALRGK